MGIPRKLGLAAVVIFVLSHFLPAYSNASGFGCLAACWSMLFKETDLGSGGWYYYSGFALSSILFMGLVVALFVTKKSRSVRLVLSVVLFLHVLSWMVVHFFQEPPGIDEIKIGYYVWLIAYGLLVAAHLWKEPFESPRSIPVRQYNSQVTPL